MQGKCDGKVEAVVGRFLNHDKGVLLRRKIVEVNVVLRRCQQITQLAYFGLKGHGMEELNDLAI